MIIKRWNGKIKHYLVSGGINMENVIVMEKYTTNAQETECEWDVINNIFQNAFKKKGWTKEDVREMSNNILKEVRSNEGSDRY